MLILLPLYSKLLVSLVSLLTCPVLLCTTLELPLVTLNLVLEDLWVTLVNPDPVDDLFPVTTLLPTCPVCLLWVLTVKFLLNNSVNTLPDLLLKVTVDPLELLLPLEDVPLNNKDKDNLLSPLVFLNDPDKVKPFPTVLPLLLVVEPTLPFLPTVSLALLVKLVNKLVLKVTRVALKSRSLLPVSPLLCSPTLLLKSKSKCSERRKFSFLLYLSLLQSLDEKLIDLLRYSLYPKIHSTQPDLAGKITGMLLEMDSSELLYLLENDDALEAKIKEALDVLDEFAKRQTGEATA